MGFQGNDIAWRLAMPPKGLIITHALFPPCQSRLVVPGFHLKGVNPDSIPSKKDRRMSNGGTHDIRRPIVRGENLLWGRSVAAGSGERRVDVGSYTQIRPPYHDAIT